MPEGDGGHQFVLARLRSHATVLVAPADVTARGTIATMTENADTVLREALALPPDERPTTLRLGP